MTTGLPFEINGPSETKFRVRAALFTVYLSIDVELTNVGSSPLQVRPDNLIVLQGNEVMKIGWSRHCEGRADEEMVLAHGESCLMRVSARAVQSDNALRELTVVHFGVSRAGKPVQVLIPLERL